jgi:hypothetical protein
MRGLNVCGVVMIAACSREPSGSHKSKEAPEPPASVVPESPPPLQEDPCPKSAAPVVANAPVVIADKVRVFQSEMPLRWFGSDKHLYELDSDPRRPKDLGHADGFKSAVWDDKYWYRAKCFENCDNRTSMGRPVAVERIDRVTGESNRLGKGDYGLGNIRLFGDYVYWGVYGHQIGGGVTRVSKAGGDQEDIRIAKDAMHEDKIEELRGYPAGILAQGTRTIAWIPANGERPRMILEVSKDMGPAVLDGDSFYVAERGDPYWQSKDSGFIHRVAVADGKDTKLAGPVRWPSAIATFGSNVYFMLKESGDIWSVPKDGGETRVVLPNGPRLEPCDESLGLWADERGLFWLRGKEFFSQGDRIYFLPWSAVAGTDSTPAPATSDRPNKKRSN